MNYDFDSAISVLERTPAALGSLLKGLPDEWILNNEGPETFSPFDVIGHLIHGEKTDWPDRIKRTLEHGISLPFTPFDRFAMYEASKGKNLPELLDEFEKLRQKNLNWFRSLNLTNADLEKKGIHPVLGEVTMRQLLAVWVVHDLTHIAQIGRVMAKQYKEEIGPWVEFFRVLHF